LKKALIIGYTGQDGAYLSKLLLEKNYHVIGISRNHNTDNFRIDFLGIKEYVEPLVLENFEISNLIKIINEINPTEIYNLGAQSSVGKSFEYSADTLNYNIFSVHNWLEALKITSSEANFFQASSSEIYGDIRQLDQPIKENYPCNPINPYGISKTTAHFLVKMYRYSYDINCSNGILFNHESCLRGNNYVIKKIINAALGIKLGLSNEPILLGNTNIQRDWGYAPFYVEAMWKILQHNHSDDYNICSGNLISLNDFIHKLFYILNLNVEKYIKIDAALFRPNDIEYVFGSNEKIKQTLNWEYNLTTDQLISNLIYDEEKFIEWSISKRK
jgi:GDPmannose 4,6-dehydratase